MDTTSTFKQFRPMIEGAAWQAHKKYQIDIEELRGRAYLVFCEAVERYDPCKASFSTHLFSRLRTVKDYAAQTRRKENNYCLDLLDEEMDDNLIDICFEQFEAAMDRLETALDLSDDAQEIIDFLISREWETPGINRVPHLFTVKKYYRYWKGWGPQRVEQAWEEIRDWWQSGNYFLREA